MHPIVGGFEAFHVGFDALAVQAGGGSLQI
jgi:hypothetical protein